ncbi:MAG: type VI secretion system tip protein VgrG [Deltaproteobacteria bacterium]|nr:type VI secretion system tip protein VgrG [Deltaproteobacteria bacterium]
MRYLTEERFLFISRALPEDAFGVVNFKGTEGLSQPYEFEIELVAEEPDLDLASILRHTAVFVVKREDGNVFFNGVLAEFEQLQAFGPYYFYRARLVPKFWRLSLIHHNQVFLDKALPDFFRDVLSDAGLTGLDYEFRFQHDYHPWEYVCQYQESHLNFLSRWMEREGIYYFFEQTENSEKIIFTDSMVAHVAPPQGRVIRFSPPSGLDSAHRLEVVKSWRSRQRMLPQNIFLKDYNYRRPSLEMTGQAAVAPDSGLGQVFIYGDHFRAPQEGDNLARVRAEALLCREQLFTGESAVPYIKPGYIFELNDHFRKSFNQNYLITRIEHEGSQSAYLTAGLKADTAERETNYYRNSFEAIPANLQYRSERLTPKPRIYGVLNAKIDAAGSTGQYAELDDHGRYKVVMPFDLSGRSGGKASAFLRMAQPYAGSDHGMHFPLHKGTEVLLTFIDGDPDRPIITGAVPNPDTPSPVNAANQTTARITTGGQNKIHFEDLEGSKRMLLQTPQANTWFRMGAPNDPPSWNDNDAGGDNPGENPEGEEENEWGKNYQAYEESPEPKTSGDPEWDEKYQAYEESPEPKTSGDPEWDAQMHTQEDKENWEEWSAEEQEDEAKEDAKLHEKGGLIFNFTEKSSMKPREASG